MITLEEGIKKYDWPKTEAEARTFFLSRIFCGHSTPDGQDCDWQPYPNGVGERQPCPLHAT